MDPVPPSPKGSQAVSRPRIPAAAKHPLRAGPSPQGSAKATVPSGAGSEGGVLTAFWRGHLARCLHHRLGFWIALDQLATVNARERP